MLFPTEYDIRYDYRLHVLIYMHRFIKNTEEHDNELVHNLILPWDYKLIV